MRHFSEKTTGRRTGDNSNPNSYQAQKDISMFFKFAQLGVLLPEWHTCSTIGFKGHTGAIFCDTGQTESGVFILFHQKFNWFMVNHKFTSNWFYGKMRLPGVTGG